MIAIDTNVLVRVLVNDPQAEDQCQLARDLLMTNKAVWVCRVVLVETVWVLQSAYKFSKNQIVGVLEKLMEHPGIHLEDAAILDSVLTLYSATNVGFADCLILTNAQHKQLVLHTFDLKLSKVHGAAQVGK
ncbi:MAG: type II toxin-antitoxin system VapC family toxin [Methylococcales bacterium]